MKPPSMHVKYVIYPWDQATLVGPKLKGNLQRQKSLGNQM